MNKPSFQHFICFGSLAFHIFAVSLMDTMMNMMNTNNESVRIWWQGTLYTFRDHCKYNHTILRIVHPMI